jgi:uncharacterized protein DUF3800
VADVFVFADEAGNFDFTRNRSASRYFVLATVTMSDCSVGDQLQALRRDLVWRGYELPAAFHAAEDAQAVRDDVFDVIQAAKFRVDATVFEKAKAMPHLQSEARLYKMAWFLHFKYVAPRIASRTDRLMVTAAAISTKRKRQWFHAAVQDVVQQVSTAHSFRTAFWYSGSDPCLQLADYCCWAVQRKWELGDLRSYKLIHDKVRSEMDIWEIGKKLYY